MKLVFITFLLCISASNHCQAQKQAKFIVNSFTTVPDDLMGCGNSYYLSKEDKKKGRMICTTDLNVALIYIDHKQLRLKAQGEVYTSGKYTLIIRDGPTKQEGDEYYVMKATIIIKYGTKVIWSKNLPGDGGC